MNAEFRSRYQALCISDFWYWYTQHVSVILILILYPKCIVIFDTWYFFVSRPVSWYMYHWYSPKMSEWLYLVMCVLSLLLPLPWPLSYDLDVRTWPRYCVPKQKKFIGQCLQKLDYEQKRHTNRRDRTQYQPAFTDGKNRVRKKLIMTHLFVA